MVTQVYTHGNKKGDAEQLAELGCCSKNITENSPRSHARFLDCIPLGSTIYPENKSSSALYWQTKAVTNLPKHYLGNGIHITCSMEQMKRQSSEDVLSFAHLLVLLLTDEKRALRKD